MRYLKLDGIRGITLISMILYHLIWDLVYLFRISIPWYQSDAAYIWQQSICWSFILLSGFCWSMGRKKWKRGLLVLGFGLLITVITSLTMPETRIVFGILTLLGFCILILIPLEKILCQIPGYAGLGLNVLLFLLTRNVNQGFWGFETINLWKIPEEWYRNMFTTFIGFPMREFYSTDYFSLLPWIFLFLAGYFLYRIASEKKLLSWLAEGKCVAVEKLGRKSLVVYILHQPVLYFCLNIIF